MQRKGVTWYWYMVYAVLAAGGLATAGEYKLKLPLGLQAEALYVPEDNQLTEAKVALGKQLYFDKRLSRHQGAEGRAQRADDHQPSLQQGAVLGWRAASLEDQAKGPIANPIEMGFTHEGVVKLLKGIKGYRDQFKKVFGTEDLTIDHVAMAIASYERTILSGNSPFDKYQAGDKTALSEAAQRGLALFNGKANCFRCHTGFNFTDEGFHNIGVGWDSEKKEFKDTGRYQVTKEQGDKGAFKTPTLRNIAQTAPYMHDGSEKTLEDVVEYYDRGGTPNPYLAAEVKPLNLTAEEKKDLVAFLRSLTGEIPKAAVTEPTSFPQ